MGLCNNAKRCKNSKNVNPKSLKIQKNLSPIKPKTLQIQFLKSKFEKSLNPNPMLIVKTKLKAKNSKPRTKYQT